MGLSYPNIEKCSMLLYKLERAQPRNEVGFVDLTSPATR